MIKDSILLSCLKKYWGYLKFRPLQKEIITSILEGQNTLGILPTSGGKSLCYQLPGLIQPGLCLVVSPLIALIQDQVSVLQQKGISVTAIHSGMSQRLIDITLDNCIYGQIKFLYVSPERLQTQLFRARTVKMKINLFAIDEAHCISEWGHDFRPEYLRVGEFYNEFLNEVPCLALTASATTAVRKDIIERLYLKSYKYFYNSVRRPNISYSVFQEESNKYARILGILDKVKGSGIIYVRTRRETEQTYNILKRHITIDFYHAGLNTEERSKKQIAWLKGKFDIIVSTSAFGMGIDKPNVRIIIHTYIPHSLEDYYQASGRAGRDGNKAYSVLILYPEEFTKFHNEKLEEFPDIEHVRHAYNILRNFITKQKVSVKNNTVINFNLKSFIGSYNKSERKIIKYSIKVLTKLSLISIKENTKYNTIKFLVGINELRLFQKQHPRFSNMIEIILRTNTKGLGSCIAIEESKLAKILKFDLSNIVQDLQYLNTIKIIDYNIYKDGDTTIDFLYPSMLVENIHYSHHLLQRRRVIKEKRTSMLNYIKSLECRMITIQKYFEESETAPCRICDICTGRHSRKNTDSPLLHTYILKIISKQSIPLPKLVRTIRIQEGYTSDDILASVRYLVRMEKIIYSDNILSIR